VIGRIAAAAGIALAFLGLPAAPASAQYPGRDSRCFDNHHDERCRLLRVEMQQSLYDLPPIEDLQRDGVEVLRAFYVMGAHPANVGALTFSRRPGEAPRVEFRIPSRNGRVRRVGAEVPPEIWARVLARSEGFERIVGAPDPDGICMHPSFYNVEAADPAAAGRPGGVRVRHDSICAVTRAPETAFHLAALAITLIPRCRALDSENSIPFSLLATCAGLDSVFAAEIHNAIDVLFDWGNDDEQGVRALFAEQASLDWGGETMSGRDAAVPRWLRDMRTRGAALGWDRIERVDNGHGRVFGHIVYSVAGTGPESGEVYYRARARLDLARGADGRFHITRARIGRFSRFI
jgi:hypothetical protein